MTAEQRSDETPAGDPRTDEDEAAPAPDAVDEAAERDHLGDVPDGSGCAEIWEHLTEERDDD